MKSEPGEDEERRRKEESAPVRDSECVRKAAPSQAQLWVQLSSGPSVAAPGESFTPAWGPLHASSSLHPHSHSSISGKDQKLRNDESREQEPTTFSQRGCEGSGVRRIAWHTPKGSWSRGCRQQLLCKLLQDLITSWGKCSAPSDSRAVVWTLTFSGVTSTWCTQHATQKMQPNNSFAFTPA